MVLPGVPFSKNEGKALIEYHGMVRDPKKSGIEYFMPRTEKELTALYDLYTSGQIKSKRVSPIKHLWWSISSCIQDELFYRCLDGDKSVINEYLSYFRSFIEVTDSFRDQSFLEILRNMKTGSLNNVLSLFVLNLESEIKKNPSLTRESTHLPYTVSEIDKILNASQNFKEIKLAEYYRKYHLTDEFRNSPEYQVMYSAIAGTFEEGISITDLCTKE
jgi:hypothetical protein